MIVETPANRFRIMARMMEPKWLRAHLGWRITAPTNDNRADWSPLSA
jgi:hypothetical protein